MTGLTTEQWIQIGHALITAGAVYGAIRADLRALHLRVDYLYQRIDAPKR